jgi:hypothetical protein
MTKYLTTTKTGVQIGYAYVPPVRNYGHAIVRYPCKTRVLRKIARLIAGYVKGFHKEYSLDYKVVVLACYLATAALLTLLIKESWF